MEINKVAQVGAGYMGGGIAQSLAKTGSRCGSPTSTPRRRSGPMNVS